MENVRALLAAYERPDRTHGGAVYSGSAHLAALARLGHLPRERWTALRCPSDPEAASLPNLADLLTSKDFYLDRPADLDRLGAYAFRNLRRHPFAVDGEGWLICDRCGADGRTPHHPGGLVVGFADGTVRFVTREELGVSPGEPIIVGFESTHPELRNLTVHFERGE